jgi:trimeric autotransporter adhesin
MADLMKRSISRPILWLMAVLVGLLAPTAAQAQCARWINRAEYSDGGLDGTVWALAKTSTNTVIAGGDFTTSGPTSADRVVNRIAFWNGFSWAPFGSGMNGAVRALLVLSNGNIVAAGDFTTAGGSTANRIAVWNGTTWSALGAGLNGTVRALAVLSNGDIVATGDFTTAGGSAANRIARWNGSSWLALGTGLNASGRALAVLQSGTLVAGGSFTTAGGVAVSYIAQWNGSAWSAVGSGVTGGTSPSVNALAVRANGDLFVGGVFTTAGGVAANNIARLSGTTWSALGSGQSGGAVLALAVTLDGNGVLVGGQFTDRVARWSGTQWSIPLLFPALPGTTSIVYAVVCVPGGYVGNPSDDNIAAGSFAFNQSRRSHDFFSGGLETDEDSNLVRVRNIARMSLAISVPDDTWTSFGSGINSRVRALLVLPNGDVVSGGGVMRSLGGNVNVVSRWNGLGTSALSSLGTGFTNGSVFALARMPNGDIVAGGQFFRIGGLATYAIARWNGSAWQQYGPGSGGFNGGPSDRVLALAVMPNGDLVAGGDFTSASGVAGANRIARWNGTAWSTLGSGMNGEVFSLAVMPNGDLVAGGNFTTAGGVTVNRIARWDGTSWSALGNPVAGVAGGYATVYALRVMPNGDLIAGGNFSSAGGVTVSNIARWNGTAWSAIAPATGTQGVTGTVYALEAMPNGDIVAGGSNGFGLGAINRWNGTAWASVGSGRSNTVYALAVLPSGELIAGGNVSTATAGASAVRDWSWGRWTDTGAPGIKQQPVGSSPLPGQTVNLSANCYSGDSVQGAVTFQWRRNGVNVANGANGASKGGGTVAGASGALTTTTLATTLTITGARPSDSGDYTVVFTNSCGAVTSVAATVTITAPCPADLTGDGLIDSADLGALLSAWGTKGSPADLTDDGLVDSADLGALLSAWGACG